MDSSAFPKIDDRLGCFVWGFLLLVIILGAFASGVWVGKHGGDHGGVDRPGGDGHGDAG